MRVAERNPKLPSYPRLLAHPSPADPYHEEGLREQKRKREAATAAQSCEDGCRVLYFCRLFGCMEKR